MIVDILLMPFLIPYKISCFVIEVIKLVLYGFYMVFYYIGLILAFIYKNTFGHLAQLLKEKKHNLGVDANKTDFNIFRRFKKAIYNTSIAKNIRNKRDVKKKVFLIDFDSEDADRNEKKQVYKYVVKNADGKIVRGTFEAFSKLDVHSFLFSEGCEIYSIKTSKWITLFYKESGSTKRMKNKKLIFLLTQISTYIKAGIPLTESIRILSKQAKNPKEKKMFQNIVYELTMGENFSTALEKQGNVFPKLLVNMVRTSELTGDLAQTLDEMSHYYSAIDKTRKQVISSLTYPAVILTLATFVIAFILVWVVPQFVSVYADAGIPLPGITLFIIKVSEFLGKYWVYILLGFFGTIGIFMFLYKKVTFFRYCVQWILMRTPVIGKIIIYNEVTMFSKTFGTLLKYGVNIVESMKVLQKITNNEIYKMLIFDTISNLAKGETISASFKDHWAFPEIAYYMLLTGERTGQPSEMMLRVADYYENEQANIVTQLKALIEPAVIVMLAFIVGTILISIVVPMFSLYENLEG